jgi:hypothetical protein
MAIKIHKMNGERASGSGYVQIGGKNSFWMASPDNAQIRGAKSFKPSGALNNLKLR